MRELPRIEFGNPLLRQKSRQLTLSEIKSVKTQALIKNMRHTLLAKKLGVGLAAPQVGEGIALAVIAIRPTKHRPKVIPFYRLIINPKIITCYGRRTQMWEGCLSAGSSGLFGKALRYNRVQVKFIDEAGTECNEVFDGLSAQVVQHEVDHLNGVLFMDHVKDTRSYMTLKEYKRQVVAKRFGE